MIGRQTGRQKQHNGQVERQTDYIPSSVMPQPSLAS